MDQATSDLLTRTGPGTAMGNLMRRYWVPILGSSEIAEPDGPQVRVQIMGEKLLAFRDTEGAPGLIDEFCSHRGVSLFFWPQRRMRHSLRVSRPQVRSHRCLR